MRSFYSHRRRPPSLLPRLFPLLALAGFLWFGLLLGQANAEPEQQALVELGRLLWYDRRLSFNGEQSCNTCHLLDRYGVDGLTVSLDANRQPGARNAPSIYGASEQIAQFWDGRSATLQDQAALAILSTSELAMPSRDYVEQVLRSIPGYEPYFVAAFPDEATPIRFESVTAALAAFQESLQTPSRFDAFLRGERHRLTVAEKEGMATFIRVGCATCHTGPSVGGQLFRRLGQAEAYPTEDVGRFAVTGRAEDRHVFKVPSLRNVTKTGPYLHDGSVQTLDETVRLMGRYQLGVTLGDGEGAEILAFLQSLTGELPDDEILPPRLPPSGPDTPRRDRVR